MKTMRDVIMRIALDEAIALEYRFNLVLASVQECPDLHLETHPKFLLWLHKHSDYIVSDRHLNDD